MKDGIILGMRSGLQSIALIGFLSLHACASARPLEVARLPAYAFADTEVSTNFAFVVERPEMTQIEFAVALDASPTNCVEVAIGTDADGDGNLSPEEAEHAFGYDCGAWFCRDADGRERESPVDAVDLAQPTSRLSHVFFLNRRQLDAAWNLVKVTRRGCGDVCELVSVRGRKPGFRLLIR